jgi:hypothetical protein
VVEVTHAIVTDEGADGLTLTSPQVPGFTFMRGTKTELLRDYQEDLFKAGVRGQVLGHWQLRRLVGDEREVLVRWATDPQFDPEARIEVAQRLLRMLAGPEAAEALAAAEPNDLGETIFICCLSTDSLRWLVEQLDPRGDVVTLAVSVAEQMVFTTQIGTGMDLDWPSLAEHGLSLDTTVADFMQHPTLPSAREQRSGQVLLRV